MKQALLFGKTVLKKVRGCWKAREDGSDQDQEKSSLTININEHERIDGSESVDSKVFQETQPMGKAMQSVESERYKAGAIESYPSLSKPSEGIIIGILNNTRQHTMLATGAQIGEAIVPEEIVKKARASASGEGVKSTQEKAIRCWQCWKWGHDSNGCHLGKVCFLCRRLGHKKAECPLRKKPINSGREIPIRKQGSQSSPEFQWYKQMASKAVTKTSKQDAMLESGNDASTGRIRKEDGYSSPIKVASMRSVATTLGVEQNKTGQVGEEGSDQERKSDTMGNMMGNAENDSSPELKLGTTSSRPSDLVGEDKDLDAPSPCNNHGVCGGVGMEMVTREVRDSTMQNVKPLDMAKAKNEVNQALTGNKDHFEGGSEHDSLTNASKQGTNNGESGAFVVPISLFDVLNEDFMTNLNKVLGISLPPEATCQIYRDLECGRLPD